MAKTIRTKIELSQTKALRTDELIEYWRGKKQELLRLNTILCLTNSINDQIEDNLEFRKLYDMDKIAERCDALIATAAGK